LRRLHHVNAFTALLAMNAIMLDSPRKMFGDPQCVQIALQIVSVCLPGTM
jgi:hypothetical protein